MNEQDRHDRSFVRARRRHIDWWKDRGHGPNIVIPLDHYELIITLAERAVGLVPE